MAASAGTAQKRDREQDLVVATRALFDRRGFQDAPVEEIAKLVGIPRGLIYRSFSSKQELFVLTVTEYLGELAVELEQAASGAGEAAERLERCMGAYANYCLRYPAFLDSSMALMQRSARDLHERVSESVWLRLGQGMARCLHVVAESLRAGIESGAFDVEDPDYMANVLWTQALGAMHLARIRVGVRQQAPGVPGLFAVAPEQIVQSCVASAMATVGAAPR